MAERLFSRHYELAPEMLLDFAQQAMAALPTVTSYELAESGDQINFSTSYTWTSWGQNMVAVVESDGSDGSMLTVSGEPRVGAMSTPWGEEMHATTIESQLYAAIEPSVEVVRRNPIVMLQADHRRAEGLFLRIGATEGDERAEAVRELVSALRVHMQLEERHVYPLLGDQVDADMAEEAEVEHQLARDGLAQLEELTPDEPGFDAALTMVVAGIEHHVQEEEGEAFPRLASQLGHDRLAQLADELLATRAELMAQERNPAAADQSTSSGSRSQSSSSRPPRPKRQATRTTARKKPRAKINPDDMKKADLLERAKRAGVSGYSHMSKAELAQAISRAN